MKPSTPTASSAASSAWATSPPCSSAPKEKLDKSKAEAFAKKALGGEGFSLEDFRDQLRQIKKLGSMQSILKMLPSVGPFQGMQQAASQVDEKQFGRVEAIIDS